MDDKKTEHKKGLNLKRDFLYGMILILPVAGTIWLVTITIDLFSVPMSILFGRKIPGFASFLLTLVVITLVGILARNIIGKAVFTWFELLMSRIPIINIIYKSIKQVVNAFSFQKKMLATVLVEYPRKGMFALGFLTREHASGLRDRDGKDRVEGLSAVFIPTTPNPTSGYFLYLKTSEIIKLDVSVEDSVKILMSAGVLSPTGLPKVKL